MDTRLLDLLDRVEIALTDLTESIASYNPSISAAQALLSADDDLQKGLKELHIHQNNYARMQQLHETIDLQNEQITSTVQLLADTRADLLSIPTCLPSKDRRDVRYAELLDYAKRISRFSAPPNFRNQVVRKASETVIEGEADVVMREATDKAQGVGLEALKQEERQWLDPSTGIQFTPWPSEEIMKRGALFRLQGMLESGENIEALDFGVKEDERLGGRGNEEQRTVSQSQMKPSIGERSGGPADLQKRDQKPKVFGGLDLYDPDEED